MPDDPTLDDLSWIVLVNPAGDHSLWPAVTPPPDGWREVGPEGDRQTCLAWVDAHWTALQPRRPRADAAPASASASDPDPDLGSGSGSAAASAATSPSAAHAPARPPKLSSP